MPFPLQIALFAVPAHAQEGEEPAAEEEVTAPVEVGPAAIAGDADGRFLVTVYLGPSIPLADFGMSPEFRLEAGWMVARGKFALASSLGYDRPYAAGLVDEARVPEGGIAWRLAENVFALSAGIRWMPGSSRDPIRPEVELAPVLAFTLSSMGFQTSGDRSGPSSEWGIAPGGRASFSLGTAVGPGSLSGGLGFRILSIRGTLSGDGVLAELTPFLGYRVRL